MVKKGRRHGGGTDRDRSNIDDSLLLTNYSEKKLLDEMFINQLFFEFVVDMDSDGLDWKHILEKPWKSFFANKIASELAI